MSVLSSFKVPKHEIHFCQGIPVLAFLKALDPTFCPPSRDITVTRLLDDCYAVVK
jgi:hypothetical protein